MKLENTPRSNLIFTRNSFTLLESIFYNRLLVDVLLLCAKHKETSTISLIQLHA